MRLLFTSTAGLGHLLPLLPVARAAADAGHEVTVASPLPDPELLRSLGLRHIQFEQPGEADCDRARREHPELPFELLLFGRLKPGFALPGVRALIEGRRPDVVVSEAAEFVGGLIAETMGVPCVRVHPGIAGRGFFEGLAAPQLDLLRAELGLPADPRGHWLLEAPQLSYFPAAFDDRRPGDPPVCRVRNPSLPTDSALRSETVYVTFGTEIVGQPQFPQLARDSVTAASRTGCHVVLSIGRTDPAAFADLSRIGHGVQVEPWVDERALLGTVQAVVCHAGAGTTLAALAAGTPIVAVPFFAEQPMNAERIAATRTGVVVPPGPDLTDRLTGALEGMLAEEPAGCRPMAQAIADLPSLDHALELITEQPVRCS